MIIEGEYTVIEEEPDAEDLQSDVYSQDGLMVYSSLDIIGRLINKWA